MIIAFIYGYYICKFIYFYLLSVSTDTTKLIFFIISIFICLFVYIIINYNTFPCKQLNKHVKNNTKKCRRISSMGRPPIQRTMPQAA